MRMFKGQLFIFLIFFVHDSSCAIDALYNTGKKVWDFYLVLNQSNLASTSYPRTVEELYGIDHLANQEIAMRMHKIHVELNAIEAPINPEIFSTLMEIVASNAMIFKRIDEMEIFIKTINDDYKKFYRIIFRNGYVPNRLLGDLTTSVFLNIETNIRMIRKIMMTAEKLLPHDENLIAGIASYTASRRERLCGDIQPITEILVQLFKIAIIAEIKTSLILSFTKIYEYRENQDGTEWKVANNFAKIQFERYFEGYVMTLKEHLGAVERLYVRACDPHRGNWTLNKNAYELDGTIQTVIFQYDQIECAAHFCHDVLREETNQCHTKFYDERHICLGPRSQCTDMGAVQACVLKNGPHRFQYVNSTESGLLGKNVQCPKDKGYVIDHENFKYATCACDCDTDYHGISTVIMQSRVNSNKVITGLRFNRRNDILYIQPKVGKLESNGYIQQGSERWLAIPSNIDAFQIRPMDIEETIFFLDDLRLPAGFALTGVRFIKEKRGLLEGFAIEIFGVPIDYSSGKLDYTGKVSLSASKEHTGLPVAFEPVSSFETHFLHIPTLGDGRYVKLKRSLLIDDFGQSTLPLFDAVPMITDPQSALGGMGIFHKGLEGYAGYISLRAYGIRYEEYFENFTSAHTIEGQIDLFTKLQVD